REGKLAVGGAAGIAALDLTHEQLDGRERSPAGHAVIGYIDEAVRLQPLAYDGDDGVLRLVRHPAENAVHRDRIHIVVAAAQGDLFEARLRDLEIAKAGPLDQISRVRHVLRIKVIALAFDLRIGGGEQREAKALAKAELEHAFGP